MTTDSILHRLRVVLFEPQDPVNIAATVRAMKNMGVRDLVLVRPFRWLAAAAFNVIDRFLIDLVLVNGSAFVLDISGRVARWWQNGDVQRYLAAIVLGLAALLWLAHGGMP